MNRIGIRLGIFMVMLITMVGSASAANCGAGTAKPVCECGDTVIGDCATLWNSQQWEL